MPVETGAKQIAAYASEVEIMEENEQRFGLEFSTRSRSCARPACIGG